MLYVHFPGVIVHVRVIRARLALGVLGSEEVPGLAASLLEAGYDTEELRVLALESGPWMSEVEEPFRRALEKLGYGAIEDEDAVMVLLRHHLRRVAQGEVPPREGLGRTIAEAIHPGDARGVIQSHEFAYDSLDLQELYGAYYSYDDLAERPNEVSFEGRYGEEAVQRFDCYVRQLAKKWLDEHG